MGGWRKHTCRLHILQIENLHLKAPIAYVQILPNFNLLVLINMLSWGVAHWEQMVPWETDGLRAGNFQELLWEMGSHPLPQRPILKAQHSPLACFSSHEKSPFIAIRWEWVLEAGGSNAQAVSTFLNDIEEI